MRIRTPIRNLIAAGFIAMGSGGYALGDCGPATAYAPGQDSPESASRPFAAAPALAARVEIRSGAVADLGAPRGDGSERVAAHVRGRWTLIRTADTVTSGTTVGRYFSARRTIGLPVSAPAERRVGKVRDLLIDLDTTTVTYAELVMDRGTTGWLPLNELRPGAEQAGFVLDMTIQRLRDLLSVSIELPRLARSTLRATELLRRSVADADGRRVGTMADVVVNLPTGAVEYTVVRFKPGVLARNELLTFRPDQLTLPPKARLRDPVALRLRAAELKSRQGYALGEWEGIHDPAYWLNRDRAPRPGQSGT